MSRRQYSHWVQDWYVFVEFHFWSTENVPYTCHDFAMVHTNAKMEIKYYISS